MKIKNKIILENNKSPNNNNNQRRYKFIRNLYIFLSSLKKSLKFFYINENFYRKINKI